MNEHQSKPTRLSHDLSSSPPRAIEQVVDTGVFRITTADPSTAPSPISPTLTLGHSSPELPPLPSLPDLTGPQTPAPDTESSKYYTASWGSPYDEPPPNSITASLSNWHRRSATASSEIDSPSPRFGLSHLIPSRLPTVHPVTPTRPSTPSPESLSGSPPKLSYFANSAQSLRQLLSPKSTAQGTLPKNQVTGVPNWALRGRSWRSSVDEVLLEVELQASSPQCNESDLEKHIEPFQLDGTADTTARTDRLRDKGHKSRDSNLTLTQHDFWPSFNTQEKTPTMLASRYADPAIAPEMREPLKSPSPQLPTPSFEGPPPSLQWQRTASSTSVPGGRPKKRVMYNGKSCWINIPQETSRETEGFAPVPLSAEEVAARYEMFQEAGYDTRGFGHWNDADPLLPPRQTQNRCIYPDPAEDIAARKQRDFRVRVPDLLAWKAYEDFLREEKLRALGVNLGGESDAAPMSRQSSSQFSSSLPFSPPLPTSSAGSQRHGHHSSVFQTGFVPGSSNHTSTRSIASPISSLSNPRGHMHRQSMFASPSLPHPGRNSPGLSTWSPQQFINQHSIPSGGSPALPDFDRQSPISPFVAQNGTQQYPFGQRDELLAQMQRQKQQQMQHHLQQQQQQMQQKIQQHTLAARPASNLPELPEVESEEESVPRPRQALRVPGPEIVNPKPSHRHNISVKLERDIQNSDYHLEDSIHRQLDDDDDFDKRRGLPPQWQSPASSQQSDVRAQLPQRTSSLKKQIVPSEESRPAPLDGQRDSKDSELVKMTSSDALSESQMSNPWANDPTFKPRDPSPEKHGQPSNHSSKASTSGLNIAAKEFSPSGNPSANFNPAIFSSSAFSNQPAKTRPFVPSGQSSRHGSNASISGLSASAPAFSPTGASTFSPKAAAFSPTSFGTLAGVSTADSKFSFVPQAPVFKPTAPAFKPSNPSLISEKDASIAGSDSGKIFSNLNITDADTVKPSRRSKAVPIRPPSTIQREDKEDEDGRITQGDERQKRARFAGSDGHQVPLFALPLEEKPLPALPQSTEGSIRTAAEDPLSLREVSPIVDVPEAEKPAERYVPEVEIQPENGELALSADESELPVSVFPLLEDTEPGAEPRASPMVPSSSHEDEAGVQDVEPKSMASDRVVASNLSALATPSELKPNSEHIPKLISPRNPSEGEPATPLISSAASTRSLSTASKTQLDNSSDRIEEDVRSGMTSPPKDRLPSSVRYYDDLEQPSFQEIDAVMKHFDEEGSDAGVERDEPSWPNSSPERELSPHRLSRNDPEFAAKIRSDAPSPSPRRYLFAHPPDLDSASITQDPFSDTRAAPVQDSPLHNLNDTGDIPISDWDDAVSSAEDGLLRSRSSFFDNRVSDLIQGALQSHLAPMEKRLQHIIEDRLNHIPSATSRRRGTRSRATMDSDADDEDDDVETDAYSRGWSPKRDRRMDKFKTMLQDALAASQPHSNTLPPLDQLRELIEESIGRQNQALVSSREQAIIAEDNERFSEFSEKFKEAATRITEETQARREAERREEETLRLLKLTEEELSLVKRSSDDADTKVKALEEAQFHDADEEGVRARLSKNLMTVTAENNALKETLEEYRISSDKWRYDIEQAGAEKERVQASFNALRIQTEEVLHIRESMRAQIDQLQNNMNTAITQLANERAKWARTDTEHRSRYEVLSARIEAEGRTRERLEQELERLELQEQEGMRLRIAFEQAQKENTRIERERERLEMEQRDVGALKVEHVQTQKDNTRLEELVVRLRMESAEHQKTADQYAQEFREARDAGRMEVQRTRGLMEVDIEAANNQVNMVRADLESQLSRIRNQLESDKMDADTTKAKHELELEQAADAKRDAIQELTEAKTNALQEQRNAFEERMEELRKSHRRDLDHVIENKNQTETFLKESQAEKLHETRQQYERAIEQGVQDKEHSESLLNDRLSLADSKIDHLQDIVLHLEEKLEIAKSAAHAAALAAQSAKGPGIPAPSAAPISPIRSRLPEKISPQALRESIQVLQSQLEERESRIENLEQELAGVDQEAPSKIKARDTEIGWLRELLGVRIDDLADLVNALSQTNYDREAVRNAAIRIRAGLQMEQQEKERQVNGGAQNFPTLASISNFASPKAAQLAAAIGNWRRTGSGMAPSGLSQSVYNLAGSTDSSRTQTPSKPPSSGAQSFLSGLMTPPTSDLRRTPEPDSAGASRSSLGHPLTSIGHESGSKVSRTQEKQPFRRGAERPVTPPLLRRGSYDQDAEDAEDYNSSGFYDDDGSTVEGTPRADRMRQFEPIAADLDGSPRRL